MNININININFDIKKTVKRLDEISPDLADVGKKVCTFSDNIDEDKAVEEIYDLLIDCFIQHKKKGLTKEELSLINPYYKSWYGMTLEEDVMCEGEF